MWIYIFKATVYVNVILHQKLFCRKDLNAHVLSLALSVSASASVQNIAQICICLFHFHGVCSVGPCSGVLAS